MGSKIKVIGYYIISVLFLWNYYRLSQLDPAALENETVGNKDIYLILGIVCAVLGMINYFRAKSGDLGGSLPAGTKEKVTCSSCHRTYYILDNPTTDEKLELMNKGYQWDTVLYHDACGQYTCQNCMRMRFNCKCDRGGQFIAMPAAKK